MWYVRLLLYASMSFLYNSYCCSRMSPTLDNDTDMQMFVNSRYFGLNAFLWNVLTWRTVHRRRIVFKRFIAQVVGSSTSSITGDRPAARTREITFSLGLTLIWFIYNKDLFNENMIRWRNFTCCAAKCQKWILTFVWHFAWLRRPLGSADNWKFRM